MVQAGNLDAVIGQYDYVPSMQRLYADILQNCTLKGHCLSTVLVGSDTVLISILDSAHNVVASRIAKVEPRREQVS